MNKPETRTRHQRVRLMQDHKCVAGVSVEKELLDSDEFTEDDDSSDNGNGDR